jgi:hypothetical protein
MKLARVFLVAAFALAGCATNGTGVAGAPLPSIADGLELRVENGTSQALRVFALENGNETPLGRVDALGTRSLRLPHFPTGAIQLVVRPSVVSEAHRRHISEPIHLERGQRLTWQLRASPGISDVPRLSTVRVFACDGPC